MIYKVDKRRCLPRPHHIATIWLLEINPHNSYT